MMWYPLHGQPPPLPPHFWKLLFGVSLALSVLVVVLVMRSY